MTSDFMESNHSAGLNISSNHDDLYISEADEEFRHVVSYMELYSVPVIFIAGKIPFIITLYYILFDGPDKTLSYI